MAQSPQHESKFGRILGRCLARYTRFVHDTSRVVVEPENAPELLKEFHPFILAMWHGQFVMMPTLRELHGRGYKVSAIAARHKDAALIRSLLKDFDIEVVAGAGAGVRKRDRGGVYALRTALKLLKDDSTFSITADVPPGPARQSGPGVVTIAKFSGRPVVPFAVATSRFIVLPTWSRMTINLPFSTISYVIGDPIWIPEDADADALEKGRLRVQEGLNAVTRRAYDLVGADVARVTPPQPSAPVVGPQKIGTALKVYRGGTALFGLAAPLMLTWRAWQGKEDRARRSERYGVTRVLRPAGPLAWFHAASVGETNAVLPVIERLLAERPDLHVLLTTGTVTSAALAARRLGPRAIHQFVPLDVPSYVRSFLDHWKPDLGVLAESEIWPNLIIEAADDGVPLALVNARMSTRSGRRWRRFKSVSGPLFSRFDLVLAQNEPMARAFKDLGAQRVGAVGNLKIDAPPPVVDAAVQARLKDALAGRPVFVAASTHDPEEEAIARAHRMIARELPGICTILAPRHPGRCKAIAEMLRAQGLRVVVRSSGEVPSADTDIYLADTIGELGTFYSLASVAFIGGSLIPHGGQNPVEAISRGAAVLTGPHWTNFKDFYRALLRFKGAREIANADELAANVISLLKNEGELAALRSGGQGAVASLAGALDRTVEALLDMLPESTARRAS